jgi:phytoene desaturase
MKIGIIGAGIAGIATAARLAARGHEVTVFEANDYPGGKLSAFELEGFRFDAGPSLFTMPQYVEEVFVAAGESASAHFPYQRMDVACHYFWPDGTTLNAWADPHRFAQEVEQKLGILGGHVTRFLEKSERKYQLAGHIFLEKSLHKTNTWLNWQVVKSLLRLPTFDIFTSMNRVHERHFGTQPKLVQLFNRFATYNGSDPYKAPGMLTIIPHFEHNVGVFYPQGGMYEITRSLFDLSKRKGAEYHFSAPVSRILNECGRVTGLETKDGRSFQFDRVVSNMDVYYTYHHLLPDSPRPERILAQPKSTSALIFYWGIRHDFKQLGLHNIFFSQDYKAEFEAMERGTVSDDPTVYVNITSKLTPTDAPPEGGENWFVMVNVPADQGQDWSLLIPRIRQQVIEKLSARLKQPVGDLIACEAVLEPREIERRTSSHQGALYGYSSNNTMAAFLRHPNFSNKIKGLHFVGGSVHPGGGIPLCLLSAKITADLIND